MKRFGLMLVVGVAGLAWGYGDLPDTFDASTGYVTLTTTDTTSAQSYFSATHWSDGQPPHANTNYYVKSEWCLGTPFNNDVMTAQLAVDPTCQTFKGHTLVIAGYLWYLNASYEFTFPDLRMLPGSYISYTAKKKTLNGTMTVYGTRTKPVRISFGMDQMITVPLALTIKGDPGSCLATSWSSGRQPSWVKLTGDLSEFYGTLYVGNGLSAGNSVGFWITSDCLGGTVELPIVNASLYVESATGLTVGGLNVTSESTKLFLDGSQVNAATPRLTVTNSLEITSPVRLMLNHGTISNNNAPAFSAPVEPETPGEYPLIRLTPEVVQNGGWSTERLANIFVMSTSPALTRSELLWHDDADGGKTLALVVCVTHTTVGDDQPRSSCINATNTDGGTDYYWSNESCPENDGTGANLSYFSSPGIYLPRKADLSQQTFYQFPGKMLVMASTNPGLLVPNLGTFRCDNLVLRGSGFNVWGPMLTSPTRYDENGTQCNVFVVQGQIRVLAGYADNIIQTYGGARLTRIESSVTGNGNFKLQTINYASNYKSDKGFVEFAACNTNFTGKVKVSTADNTTKYANLGIVVPNWEQRVCLFVSDERNLGGARDEFAWDALYLDQYSDLWPLNDVTFTDGWNRGIAIGNIGRMHVTNGLTLAIWRPFNVNGNLVKEGGGTLALGGPLTFGGSAQSATPTSGANLLTAMGGFVKPLATNAFDGLAITFTNNAALKVDGAPADASLQKFGLVNVKETTAPIALAPNQTTLPVTVDFGTATEPPAVQWTVGLVTLETTKAETLKQKMALANPTPFQNWRGTLDLVANGDGTSTIVVNYKTVGMTIIFR